MVETLTESFCERCGTRYEFKAPTRLNPLRKTRGLFGGLKNYLTSQDDFGDAMGDAMRSEEEQLASAQLEAFHESFNFCINCRQYTCVNCWNDDAGRCRSCAPIAGTDDLAERLAASFNGNGAATTLSPTDATEVTMAESDLQRRLGMDAWPTSDPLTSGTNGHAPAAWPTADDLSPALPAGPQWDAVSDPLLAESEPEPVEAELPWDAAFEPEPVVAEVEPEPEPEPVVAEVEPEPEPEPVALPPPPRIAPISETILRFPTRPAPEPPASAPEAEPVAAEADTPELAARRAQLDLLGLGDPGEGSVFDRPAVLPYRSRGATPTPAELAALARGGFWEASAREVAGAAANVGVQNCGQCGLSLSATARFCRRCGTRQAQPA